MLENKARGWYGSYSLAGRSSAERYQLVLKKDEILSNKIKKIKLKNYFTTEDVVETESDRQQNDENQDIFSRTYKNDQTIKKSEINQKYLGEYCDTEIYDAPEKYKYHHQHHKDLYNYNQIMKTQKKYLPSSTKYHPKMDLIWKRVITGPKWKLISGRNKKKIKIHSKIINENDKNKKNDKNDKNKKKDASPKKKIFLKTYTDKIKFIPMEKQTKRGNLPIYYDSRIRNDKAFKTTEINEKTQKDFRKKILNKAQSTKSKTKITIPNNKTKNLKTPKNTSHENLLTKHMSSIDFSKNTTRDQYYHLHRNRAGLHPALTPKFSLVEPRTLTMATMAPKSTGKTHPKRLKGIDPHLFFDADKVLNKINNYKEVNSPNFNIMVSRNINGPLPSYMSKNYDRASLNIMTEKGLKMNNFANNGLKSDYNSFWLKKSFNRRINYDLLNNDKFINEELGLPADFGSAKNMKKFIKFYSNYLDESTNMFSSSKFDNITLKSVDKHNSKNISFSDKDIIKSLIKSESNSKIN